jgi:hypothetical protein
MMAPLTRKGPEQLVAPFADAQKQTCNITDGCSGRALRVRIRQRGQGGWGSNPRPADYESSMLADAHSWLYLRERKIDHGCQRRLDRAFAIIRS